MNYINDWVLLRRWSQGGESLAKVETAVSLSKLNFLASTDIQFYETIEEEVEEEEEEKKGN